MCNHYSKDQKVIDWSLRTVPRVTMPLPLGEIVEHTYPKYPAPVIAQENDERTLTMMRWGVWPFYTKEKPQFITNARSDGLLTKPTWKKIR